jgi:hypothetical protein
MYDLVDSLIKRIENLNIRLTESEVSSLSAGLKDILDSHNKLLKSMSRIRQVNDNDQFQDALVEIQIELVNHVKPHILNLEKPLMKVINFLG